MPIPIKHYKDYEDDKTSFIDYSVLLNYGVPENSKKVIASDNDASVLFKIWSKGKCKHNKVSMKDISEVSSQDIMRLKTRGFITGDTKEIEFTRKGKIVITTMSLGEPNAFEKKRQPKTYTEILASMNKRGKKGYRMASNDLDRFSNSSNSLDLRDIFGD